MKTTGKMLILGFGFTSERLSLHLLKNNWEIVGTVRSEDKILGLKEKYPENADFIVFNSEVPLQEEILSDVTHILISTPNNRETNRDPVLEVFTEQLKKKALSGTIFWAGYLSTTGVYGDLKGEWCDETSACKRTFSNVFIYIVATTRRGKGRLRAETEWLQTGLPMHIFRLPGIYGPTRGTLARLRKGSSRRIKKENQFFSRIHVDDIVGAVVASIERPNPGRVYNVCDDLPCDNSQVVAYAAELLKIPVPPEVEFEEAKKEMSPMAQSFYTQSRRVSNKRLKEELQYDLLYPTYKEGMKAQLEEENKVCKI